MTTEEIGTNVNGFHTETLGGLVEALAPGPDGGRVTFSTDTTWHAGGRAATVVGRYRIDGAAHQHADRDFSIEGDEPREFGAGDSAPAPPEILLHAVAQCVLATTAAYAALQGVRLTRLGATVEGDVDLHGMLGLDGGVRPGLGEARIHVRVAGAADPETLEQLVRLGIRYSPIRESVENGVPIRADVDVSRS